jgi:hypothetical protein
METWYGYRSTLNRSGVIALNIQERANGSNVYLISNEDIEKLPPSHVALEFTPPPYYGEHHNVSDFLIGKIDRFLTAPGSAVSIVHDIVKIGDIYYPIYLDGSKITIPIEKRRQFLSNFNELPEVVSPGDNVTHTLFDEAMYGTLPIPYVVNDVEADFVAKVSYVYAAGSNQWLKPYADRVGYKLDTKQGFVIVPFWSQLDLETYMEYIQDETILKGLRNPRDKWHPGHILSIDGNWYPLPTDRYITEPSDDWQTVSWKGQKYDVSEIRKMKVPTVDHRLINLSKSSIGNYLGLLPFEKKYPTVKLSDGVDMIDISQTDIGIIVTVRIIDHIIGHFPPESNVALIEDLYIKLWNDGQILNNMGNYHYLDSFSTITHEMIRSFDESVPLDVLERVRGPSEF